MARMGNGYGSEFHLLRYLGRHRSTLNDAVARVSGAHSVRWLDFPLDEARKQMDREWVALDFLPVEHPARAAWQEFWPQRGSSLNWDAVGTARVHSNDEWLLVEAKAHTEEMQSTCQAKEHGGLPVIRRALDATKQALAVPEDRDWLREYYQFCNRVAALWFLAQHGVPARLLFIYFVGDRFPPSSNFDCPQSQSGWDEALAQQDHHVGLPRDHALADRIHKMYLPVSSEQ